ncbi:pirin family protein [Flavobacterium cerinum]|uniref:Quercetin 2,3-dioxygenase C-terminal cupin domain-containing protein n=1 Tax=Flavobacterium cerinum TaxID=2502784 RepID=A0ABY5IUG3_9FLAO|nr:hypothetical protein [Flavobacterium cerinum]UUC46319.1 hypothetical protein NOX80_03745 [Flavobacterium cerinum]
MANFTQQQAQIYKAHLRGHFETDSHRCLATFNFETYQEESRKPYKKLQLLNEEVLAAKITIQETVDQVTGILLIPLIGAIDCITGTESYFITVGQCFFFTAQAGGSFAIQNPYEKEQVNYLQIRIKLTDVIPDKKVYSFDLSHKNEMIPTIQNPEFSFRIGMYTARAEDSYQPENKSNGIFALVLNGAFEFQNRLIEDRDGLAIDATETIEFESLTENSILLLLEM